MMKLSQYKLSQSQAIISLITTVFARSEGKKEGELIGRLVSDLIASTDPSDLIGFVAQIDNTLVGSIFFSRLILPGENPAFILSPVAVATEYQGRGVGQQLITFGLEYIKSINIDVVVTYGDPRFYSKIGFKPLSENVIKAPLVLSHPEGWLAQSLSGRVIKKVNAASQCVAALNHQQYW